MIKQGDIIKHKAFMDVAVQVMYLSTHPDTGDIEVKGVWINQGQVETYFINILTEFVIKKNHISNWLKCLKPESNYIRKEEWKELT